MTTNNSNNYRSAAPIDVPTGGTGLATLTTAYGVVCAGTTATGALQNAGAGTAGQVLTSNGAGALPSFQANTSGGPSTKLNYNAVTPAIRASSNVTSVTYNSTGRYTINFTSSYADANYYFVASSGTNPSTLTQQTSFQGDVDAAPSTTAVRLITAGTLLVDNDFDYVIIFT